MKSINDIKFSIIMACYNSEKFIIESIDSVLNQKFRNFELIVVDDCSNDDSIYIINKYVKKYDFIKLIRLTKRVGISIARNIAIKNSSADWISILDADDKFHPNKLYKQAQLIFRMKKENLVLIGTNCTTIDDKGDVISSFIYPTQNKILKFNLVHLAKFPPHSSIVYKKSTILDLNCFDQRYIKAQDYDLLLRLSDHGVFSSVEGEPLTFYRNHNQNISNNTSNYPQLVYASAALLSYYLKNTNNSKLLKKYSDMEWENFLKWICLVFKKSKLSKNQILKSELKKKLSNLNYINLSIYFDIIKLILHIIMNFIKQPYTHKSYLLKNWKIK